MVCIFVWKWAILWQELTWPRKMSTGPHRGGSGRDRDPRRRGEENYTWRYAVASIMTLHSDGQRWEKCSCFVHCEGHSHKTVSGLQTTTFEEKGEPKRGMEPMSYAYQPNALPLGQTGSHPCVHRASIPFSHSTCPWLLLFSSAGECGGQPRETWMALTHHRPTWTRSQASLFRSSSRGPSSHQSTLPVKTGLSRRAG